MIAPCLLSGYLWRTCWVRFRALGCDEPDQPSAAKLRDDLSTDASTICGSTIARYAIMTFSLYAATVPSYRQILGAVSGLLGTAEAFCAEKGIAPHDIIQARLADDMQPFAYQVKSTAVHSLGAIEGVRRGVFSPDVTTPPETFTALKTRIADTLAALEAIQPAELDAFVGRDMRFVFGDRHVDFT